VSGRERDLATDLVADDDHFGVAHGIRVEVVGLARPVRVPTAHVVGVPGPRRMLARQQAVSQTRLDEPRHQKLVVDEQHPPARELGLGRLREHDVAARTAGSRDRSAEPRQHEACGSLACPGTYRYVDDIHLRTTSPEYSSLS
jgi:hypothetical protein